MGISASSQDEIPWIRAICPSEISETWTKVCEKSIVKAYEVKWWRTERCWRPVSGVLQLAPLTAGENVHAGRRGVGSATLCNEGGAKEWDQGEENVRPMD